MILLATGGLRSMGEVAHFFVALDHSRNGAEAANTTKRGSGRCCHAAERLQDICKLQATLSELQKWS